MKIRIVQDYLRSGGTERQSIFLGKYFQAAGHEVELITFRPRGALAATVAPVRHLTLQPFDSKIDGWAPRLGSVALRGDPNIVLCMGRMANCWAGSLVRPIGQRSARTRVIATMRTGKRLPWLFQRSLKKVDHVVANSDSARSVLEKLYGVAREKISVIHNSIVFSPESVAPESARTERIRVRGENGARSETLVLLSVGMFRSEKNQSAAIEIAAKMPRSLPWQLWFAGDGPTRAACEAQARTRGIHDRVKFFGFHEDPRPLYRAADVAVLTSLSESLSNFLIEAHAHGLPSVAYGVSGVPECGGISVEPENEIGFLAALGSLLESPELRRAEANRVAAFAREHFAPDVQARAYLNLFERL